MAHTGNLSIMRIIWITHDILNPFLTFVNGKPSKGSSWISPLFFNLAKENQVELGIITPIIDGNEQKAEIDNVKYYAVGIKRGDNTKALSISLSKKYLSAINDFEPDIIHIHGTEVNFAQLRTFVDKTIPIICSIQGIINSYYPFLKYSIADINLNKFQSVKNRLGRGGTKLRIRKLSKYSSIEKEIISINQYFIGRTMWDKAQLYFLNKKAKYFQGEELLRPAFYVNKWVLEDCVRHRIFASSSAYPIKGFHILLKAVGLLIKRYSDIQLIVPLSMFQMDSPNWKDFLVAEDYSRYLKDEIIRLGLEKNVVMLKELSEMEMAVFYKQAHVFVLPSFVENSPNAMGEAMMIGTPVITSPVGGITSIVKDEESALLFPAGDYRTLAYQIDRLFLNDKLAIRISQAANLIAKKRHNIVETVIQYKHIYQEVIETHNGDAIQVN